MYVRERILIRFIYISLPHVQRTYIYIYEMYAKAHSRVPLIYMSLPKIQNIYW